MAYNKIYTLQYDIARTKDEIKIPTGTFYNGIDGYSLRVDSRNKETDMMYNVMVYNHTKNKGNISLAVADSGMIRSTPDKQALVFTLYHGVSYEEDNTRNYRDTVYQLQQVDFDMQEVVIPLENYAFQKSEETRYGNDIMARNLEQLHHDRDSIGALHLKTVDEQRKKIVYNISLGNPRQLDTSLNKGYRDNFPIDTLVWATAAAELDAVQQSLKGVQKAIQTMQSYDREALQFTFFLRRIDLESLRKFTLSFACFIFFSSEPLSAPLSGKADWELLSLSRHSFRPLLGGGYIRQETGEGRSDLPRARRFYLHDSAVAYRRVPDVEIHKGFVDVQSGNISDTDKEIFAKLSMKKTILPAVPTAS